VFLEWIYGYWEQTMPIAAVSDPFDKLRAFVRSIGPYSMLKSQDSAFVEWCVSAIMNLISFPVPHESLARDSRIEKGDKDYVVR